MFVREKQDFPLHPTYPHNKYKANNDNLSSTQSPITVVLHTSLT